MTKRFGRPLAWAVCAGLVMTLAGCGGSDSTENIDGKQVSNISGEISIDGSSTVFPISQRAGEQFSEQFPNVEVTINFSGTGGGFRKFASGQTHISDASRPIKAEEWEACTENNISFVELPVAYDGLTIVVNTANDWCDELTVEELNQIFRAEGHAMTWKDLNKDWPDEPIKIFAPGTASGTFDYFLEVVIGDGSIRSDMEVNENDNVLVRGVSENEYAISFFGAAYYFENQEELKAIKIVNPMSGESVLPTAVTIESGEYAPFSRPLFIYVRKDAMENPEINAFVTYYLDNAAALAKGVGYVALPQEIYDEAKERFFNGEAGTHYIDENGGKRSGSLADIYTKANLNQGA